MTRYHTVSPVGWALMVQVPAILLGLGVALLLVGLIL